MDRRRFLAHSSFAALGGLSGHLSPESTGILERALEAAPSDDAVELAQDETFWKSIRKFFVTSPDLIDLDNANTAPTPAPVFSAYMSRGQGLRQAPSERFGKVWSDLDKVARPELASYLGAKPTETVFTPNATFGLNTVLHGFPLERGDEILVTNHEYPDMIQTILQRGKREGIVMRTVNVPLPSENKLALVERVQKAITPKTKLLLISHVSAWSGEILPVKEVAWAARARNVAVLVDAAQSVGLLDVNFAEIGADFLATSLHKWLSAPMGTGALLLKTEHIGKVWPLHPPSWDTTEYPLDQYEWSGTFNMAAYRSVTDALRFQRTLGAVRKRERLRFLGDHWQRRLSNTEGITILTPADEARSLGVASIAFARVPSDQAVKTFREKGIIVQDKSGRHSPYRNAIRVSPGIYTTIEELDRFVTAAAQIAGQVQARS